MFYWLVKGGRGGLLVWLEGGVSGFKSASSLNHLFTQGPLRIKKNKDYTVELNPNEQWSEEMSVLYLDQPVGSGFSYGNRPAENMEFAEEDFLIFMLKFIEKYPEYKKQPIYLAGNGLSGKT